MTFTHYGWFAFCPVKIGDVDSDAPVIAPRWPALEPLFCLAEVHEGIVLQLRSLFKREVEPVWEIKITGEIPQTPQQET